MKIFFSFLVILTATVLKPAQAAPVTFWFSGQVDTINNASNTLPFQVNAGEPFSGRVTYDPDLVLGTSQSSSANGDTAVYYYNTLAGLSVVLSLGGHTISNRAGSRLFNRGRCRL